LYRETALTPQSSCYECKNTCHNLLAPWLFSG